MECLNKTYEGYEMKINAARPTTVTRFKYLETVVIDEYSKPEIPFRIAQISVTLAWLKPIHNDRSTAYIILSN